MDAGEWDTAAARDAFRQELESINVAIRLAVVPATAAILENQALVLRLQLEELDVLESRQASQRMQHSMYRAMLADLPLLAPNDSASRGCRRQAASSDTAIPSHPAVTVNPDGSTQLEEYIDQLKIAEEPPKQCYACMEETPINQGVILENCSHFWCHECLRRCFDLAIKNEGGHPVRCCEQLPKIPMDNPAIASVLGSKMITDLKAKIVEYETPNRTYCHERSCSTFIPPDQVLERMAACPICQNKTCAECKTQYHESPDCTAVHDEAFDEWRTKNQAATCPGCHRVVVISYGCNHMLCPCGSEFCYECSVIWKECTCERWHNDRLLDRAAEVADRLADGMANAVQVQQVAEALRAEGGCRHNNWTRTDLFTFTSSTAAEVTCADCHWRAGEFLWRCDRCGMRVCSRCRVDYKDFDDHRDY
ncbi:hypothetical protein EDD37DRAFT_483116 [Exophiala viscosa]|uniref:uncharacterized protein n=1 Tax=Exophiala viscosa TaxID=2486360 RepID=UPI00219DD869|nr:hypothetical protein EDD37DRAFT_483116 [Exophiala viscosa]